MKISSKVIISDRFLIMRRLLSTIIVLNVGGEKIPQGTPSPAPLGPGHRNSLGTLRRAGTPGPVPVSAATSGPWCV